MDTAEFAYVQRTLSHIRRVQDNALFLIKNHVATLSLTSDEIDQLFRNILIHDKSKWSTEQFQPYVNKFNRKIDDGLFDVARRDHYTRENHHYHNGQIFFKIEMIEVICDLQAMAQEFDEGTCERYFNGVWVKEWRAWGDKNQGTDLSLLIADDYKYNIVINFMRKVINCF